MKKKEDNCLECKNAFQDKECVKCIHRDANMEGRGAYVGAIHYNKCDCNGFEKTTSKK